MAIQINKMTTIKQ